MDEATAALDPPSQEQLMPLVLQQLPEATVVSVGHRPELDSLQGTFRRSAKFLSRLFTRGRPAEAAAAA